MVVVCEGPQCGSMKEHCQTNYHIKHPRALVTTGGGHLHRRSVLMSQCKRPPLTLRSEKELSLKCSILDKLRSIICSMTSLLHHLSQAIQNNYLLQFQLHPPTCVIHKEGRLWRRQGDLPVLSIKEEDCGDVKGTYLCYP